MLGHAEMLDLRVREHLVDRIDRAAGHARGIELLDPGLARLLLGVLLISAFERLAVLRAVRGGGVFRPVRQVGRADRLAEAEPDAAAGVAMLM